MNPKISVIIPVYNCVDLVRRALESVPQGDDIQIIVVDDGSTDGSYEVEFEWYSKYASNKAWNVLTCIEKNSGVAHAMNTGFGFAKGEYIVSLSSDDYYKENFDRFRPYLDGKNDLVYFDLEVNSKEIWKLSNATKNTFVGATKFIRREFLGDTRIPEDVKYMEDIPFHQALQAKNPKEVFTGIVLKHYNWPREGSLINLANKEKK